MKVSFSIVVILVSLASAIAQKDNRISHNGLSWSPDGKFLSFTGYGGGVSQVYVARADGSEVKTIASKTGVKFGTSWTTGRIAYGFGVDGAPERDIYSSDPNGSDLRQLTKGAGLNYNPSFSPDGKRIIFVSNRLDRSVSHHIYTMNADGSDVRLLTAKGTELFVSFGSPQWSPDGKKIAFEVIKGDGADQIWTMNADGSNKTLVTGGIGNNGSPGWSPDGKRLLFVRELHGTEGKFLYTINADGSGLSQTGAIKALEAKFSPDGKKIGYISGTFASTVVYVANADGSGVVRLTK